MTAERRRGWRDWSAGDRLGIGYALLAIAELVVLLLAWQGVVAIHRQQRTVERNLTQFANFGAANFAYRAGALVFNHANMVSEDVDRIAARSTSEVLARAGALTDSLSRCRCEAGVRIRALMVMDGAANVIAQSPASRVVLPPRTLAAMYAKIREFTYPVLTVRMTDETGVPTVIALSRVGQVKGSGERFFLSLYDPDSVSAFYDKYIYEMRPSLLPSVYGWQSSNSSVVGVRVTLPGGMTFYQSPRAPATGYSSSVGFGPDTLVRVSAALTPSAAKKVRGESAGPYAPTPSRAAARWRSVR